MIAPARLAVSALLLATLLSAAAVSNAQTDVAAIKSDPPNHADREVVVVGTVVRSAQVRSETGRGVNTLVDESDRAGIEVRTGALPAPGVTVTDSGGRGRIIRATTDRSPTGRARVERGS